MTSFYRGTILALAVALIVVSCAYYVEHKRAEMGQRYRESLIETRAKWMKASAQVIYYKTKLDVLKKTGRLLPPPNQRSLLMRARMIKPTAKKP